MNGCQWPRAAEGTPILAVWGVCDGICDCPKGSECPSPGKHPYPKFCPNGVYSATTDAATFRRWHAIDPRINFGEAMGEVIRIDVDPRNGGDATYFDPEEAHGEFTPTREKKTGGGGRHKKYRLPETIKRAKGELKCKLGPGVDVKAAGGYIIAPGSSHVSGRPYGFETDSPVADAPEWIVETLKKAAAGESPPPPIDFQDYRDRRRTSTGGARFFGKRERNDGLRDVMLGRWTHGYAEDASDLYRQVLEVRDTRCEHDPADPPPSDRDIWDLVQRTVRNYARGERGGAA
ncbi:MAG TPA: bifunctional DNA primase/polymerase [Pyrinomonadaceae bacterium]